MPDPKQRRNCKCAWMVCAHCRKRHDGPNGECTVRGCPCKGFI